MFKKSEIFQSVQRAFPNIFLRLAFGAVIMIIFGIINPNFFAADNLRLVLLTQSPTFLLLSCAMTIAILLGGIDLSIGSSMAISTCTCALMLKATENPALSIIAGIMVGMCVGAINGVLISKVKIPTFIATYGMDWVIKGTLYIMMNGLSIFGFVESFRMIGTTSIGVFPLISIVTIVIVGLLIVLLHMTTFGKRFYATARNRSATVISGISSTKMIISSYMIIGFLSSLDAVDATLGENWTLKLVAITLLGGTQNNGGVGSVVNTMVGTFIYLFIMNALNTIGIPSTWQDAIIGGLVILAVSLEGIGLRIQATKSKAALKKQTI